MDTDDKKIGCCTCSWEGKESELKEVKQLDEHLIVVGVLVCPKCSCEEYYRL